MKESYREGVANHSDPEPCEGSREVALEALDRGICRLGYRASKYCVPGCRWRQRVRRQNGTCAKREHEPGPAESEAPSMQRNSMRENRETPSPPVRSAGREENAMSGKSFMNLGSRTVA